MQFKVTPSGRLPKDRDPLDVIEFVLLVNHVAMDAQDIRNYAFRTWGWTPARQSLLRSMRILHCQERAVEVRKNVYIHPNEVDTNEYL